MITAQDFLDLSFFLLRRNEYMKYFFSSLFFFSLVFVPSVLAFGEYSVPLPDPLLIDKSLNVIGDVNLGTGKTVYAYTTETVPFEINEINRTESTRVFDLGSGKKEYKIYSGVPQFFYTGNEWKQVEYGETDTSVYQKLNIVVFDWFSFLMQTALAQTTYYSSMDGYVGYDTTAISWNTLTAGSGNWSNSNGTDYGIVIGSDSSAGNWTTLSRIITLFDTSAIIDTDTITNATAYFWGGSTKADPAGWTPDINLYTSTPASDTTLVNADYAQIGAIAKSTAISYANWSTSSYNSFVLNDFSVISKNGITKLGLRNSNYDVADISPTWSASQIARLYIYFSEQAGTTNDPYLSIISTAQESEVISYSVSTSTDMIALTQLSFLAYFVFLTGVIGSTWIFSRYL
ncbi:MAG: hypothetical protein A2W22_00485 [Candidatus Levybacteria bacterium RBG_16_35_11]|nr:MAG: hypothetical protein A2W22_00485 [Candidatus Levybacteria bacterium RBG_16_35_11]